MSVKMKKSTVVVFLMVEHQLANIQVRLVKHVHANKRDRRLLRLILVLFFRNRLVGSNFLDFHHFPFMVAALSPLLDLNVVNGEFRFLD